LVISKPGETFSRRKLEATAEAMTKVLANIGYAFADVSPLPQLDKENRTVGVTFFVNPGKRVQVRRINFQGNTRTQDEVLRRELRQFEGAWFSQAAIDRSKIRLQRLGFFKTVEIETPRVAGSEDLVDVTVKVEEQSSGAFQFGLGYSQLQGLLTSVSVTQRNFLGTGNSIGVTAQNNIISKTFEVSYFDPYFTDDGLSVGYNIGYRELDQGQANIASYTSDIANGEAIFGIPLTETDTVQVSLGLDRNRLTTIDGLTPTSLINFLVAELGDRQRFPCLDVFGPDGTIPEECQTLGDYRRWTINTWTTKAYWARDSRNKFFAPTRGSFQRLGAEVAMPGSDLEFYKITYQAARYFPVNSWLTLLARGEINYGDGYGDTQGLPFYENFYAGGTRDVRGFQDNTLGPCDDSSVVFSGPCQPLGGAFKTTGSLEVIFPTPFAKRNEDSTQISAFLDIGNVYSDFDAWSAGDLRASVGVSFKWQAPVGPIVVNLAAPIRKKDGDRTENLQFSFGNTF
jgi:outer membrane protein insertion porin family